MIPISNALACIVTLFLSLILPLAFWIVYGIKNKGQGIWSAWLLGAAGFVVTQVLIRIPILNGLSQNAGFLTFAQAHPVVYGFSLAFTAGLFELAGRYAVARRSRQRHHLHPGRQRSPRQHGHTVDRLQRRCRV